MLASSTGCGLRVFLIARVRGGAFRAVLLGRFDVDELLFILRCSIANVFVQCNKKF